MSKGLALREAQAQDVAFIASLESRPEYRDFILADPPETHLAQLQGQDHKYLIAEDASGPLGYAILAGLGSSSGSIELDRLAVSRPGRGVGRFVVSRVMDLVFGDLGARRLWLDVTRDNRRARRLYESLGFGQERILPQAAVVGGRKQDLVVMSLLAGKYASP